LYGIPGGLGKKVETRGHRDGDKRGIKKRGKESGA